MPTNKHQTHPCLNQKEIDKIDDIKEDINTLKLAFGYKEKSNGEFREQVEKEDNSIRGDILNISSDVKELRNTMINVLIGLFGILGILMTVLIVAIKLY